MVRPPPALLQGYEHIRIAAEAATIIRENSNVPTGCLVDLRTQTQ